MDPLPTAWDGRVARPSLWILGLIAVGTFATAIQRTFWISARLREKAAPGL
jgi:hypothetical protein